MKQALVTGAAGFFGSHLAERLLAEGWAVRGVDRLASYYEPALKRANLEQLAGSEGCRGTSTSWTQPCSRRGSTSPSTSRASRQ